jgi:hypothetical protein
LGINYRWLRGHATTYIELDFSPSHGGNVGSSSLRDSIQFQRAMYQAWPAPACVEPIYQEPYQLGGFWDGRSSCSVRGATGSCPVTALAGSVGRCRAIRQRALSIRCGYSRPSRSAPLRRRGAAATNACSGSSRGRRDEDSQGVGSNSPEDQSDRLRPPSMRMFCPVM